ncbi:MAG: response regulator transcription factor [Ginsengibacter sp.]|jgi:DNA-binding NarL/FixJ family response regulator
MCEILIADDHPIVLMGSKTFLKSKGFNIVSACTNGIEAYNQILLKRPDVALIDISMPGMSGLDILKKLQDDNIPTKIVLLTLQNELSVFNYAKSLGVKGFLLKEFAMEEIEKCIHMVKAGNTYFSPHLDGNLFLDEDELSNNGFDNLTFAEKRILQLISLQRSSKEIAADLFISEKTVETHRSHIIKKLNIPSEKNALLKWAIENKNSIPDKF